MIYGLNYQITYMYAEFFLSGADSIFWGGIGGAGLGIGYKDYFRIKFGSVLMSNKV